MALQWNAKGNLKGPQGDKGDTGEKGETGASTRTVNITVSADSDVSLDQITPSSNVKVDDLLIDATGSVFAVASVSEGVSVHVGSATGVNLQGPQGETGPAGADGKDGTGVTILGSYDSEEELKENVPTGSAGDAYLVDGDLYVWSATEAAWKNVGSIQGPQGEKGEAGENATITDATASVDETVGTPNVQLTMGGTDSARTFDFKFSGLKGETGETGAQGAAGPGITIGSGAPTSTGVVGETYMDITTGDVYQYENVE